MTTPPGIPVDQLPAKPTWWATGLVALAAAILPSAEHRQRYRLEFVAELYGMPDRRQARYAGQVLSRAWALRSALREGELPIGEDGNPVGFWRLCLCRVQRHRWRWYSTEDGDRYQRCVRCGSDRIIYDWGAPWPMA